MKTDIQNLEDIEWFVNHFYQKVQADNLIGPVFNTVITDWEPHLQKMYQFWNAALFSVPGFRGNPFARHAPLSLKKEHFVRWILLFNETINSKYEGDMAEETKKRAQLMADIFLSKIEAMGDGIKRVIV